MWDKLEPEVHEPGLDFPVSADGRGHTATLSAAISLKRIADALEKLADDDAMPGKPADWKWMEPHPFGHLPPNLKPADVIQVRLRDGQVTGWHPAESFAWGEHGDGTIEAYRVVTWIA